VDRIAIFNVSIRYGPEKTVKDIMKELTKFIDQELENINLMCDHPLIVGKEALDLCDQLDCLEDCY